MIDLLAHATRQRAFRRLRAAVAYATQSGVQLLERSDACRGAHLKAQWLVALDWCRSEPAALGALDSMPRSSVRVPFGIQIVGSPRCAPRIPFHPKGFLFLGPNARLLVSGSANLSRNGLSIGHELDTVIEVRDPETCAERHVWRALEETNKWFRNLWQDATRYSQIENRYQSGYSDSIRQPAPTSDDATNAVGLRTRFRAEDLLRLRSAQHLWIEAGNVTKNRGRGLPGNQIMMRAMSRVFFGVEARDVPTDTHLLELAIRHEGHISWDRTLRYSNNSMDVLTVPVPGVPTGPPFYDNQILVFSKASHDGALIYELIVVPTANRVHLRRRSERVGGHFVMSGGRQFGIY